MKKKLAVEEIQPFSAFNEENIIPTENIVETDKIEIDPEFELFVKLPVVGQFEDFDSMSELEIELEVVSSRGQLDPDQDIEEDESGERHAEHIRRKKVDKIFNNSYNTGDGYGLDEQTYRSDIDRKSVV